MKSCALITTAHLYELPLLPTLSCLQGEGSVSIDGVCELHPDLGILMDLMRLLRVVELSPGGGDQDVDIMELRPARAGRVKRPAALHHPLLDVLNGLLTLGLLNI